MKYRTKFALTLFIITSFSYHSCSEQTYNFKKVVNKRISVHELYQELECLPLYLEKDNPPLYYEYELEWGGIDQELIVRKVTRKEVEWFLDLRPDKFKNMLAIECCVKEPKKEDYCKEQTRCSSLISDCLQALETKENSSFKIIYIPIYKSLWITAIETK